MADSVVRRDAPQASARHHVAKLLWFVDQAYMINIALSAILIENKENRCVYLKLSFFIVGQ